MTSDSLALKPGVKVDSLRIDRVLGQGAFGITYLVTDQVLGKSFALKEYVPRDHVFRAASGELQPSNDQSRQKFATGLQHFLQEGRTVAPLEHPNVVKVFRCFEANGTAYLLMPYYRGEALHKLLKRSGTLTADEALALVMPLIGALEYIHSRNVIHQDIKPANIYITETGEPLLLDFGAAGQRLDADTSTRWRLGSEGYAAPEQSKASGKIGPWTDIYALAATLYRSISGKLPVAASQRVQAISAKEPDPLPAIAELVPGPAFANLVNAIDQGLQLSERKRPQTVNDWRQSFKQGSPRQPERAVELPEGIEREGREWLPIILLVIVLAAMLGGIIYLFTGDSPEPGKPVPTETVDTPPEPPATEPATPSEEKQRWQAALEADTPFAYRLFIEDFPESLYRLQAQQQLDALDEADWEKVKAERTRSVIETHLETFPGGLHEADAKIMLNELDMAEAAAERERQQELLRDDEAWNRARTTRTLASVDAYLNEWPGGQHVEDARALRQQIAAEANDIRAFEAAQKLNTIGAYQAYIDAFPGGRRVAQALEMIDNLTLRPGKTFKDCPDCPTMIVVPGGNYWQGADESSTWALGIEKPRRLVTLQDPIAVGVFEITMQQWDNCVADGGCSTRPRDNGWGRGTRPVIMVSWNDAQEYASWISKKTGQSYRLPSESEWEYFARAGEEGEWLGGEPAALCEFANIAAQETGLNWQHESCADPAPMETLPVGSLRPNAFGLHDVIGNVAEWTLDCMNLSYLDAPADGSAWGRGICSSRMTRGGSWFTGSKEVRLSSRFNLKTGDRNDFTGFRLVREVEDQ